MPPHDNRAPRRDPARPLTPEQAAAIRALGLKWRDEWRAEIAARAGKTNELANGHAVEVPAPRPPGRTKSATQAAAHFASAVARNEFGRFYWNDKQQVAMQESLKGGGRHRKSRMPQRA
jgi:hypothetical protein